MTRCLDCGFERATDQCPSCGLTSAAAEVMFRRRLVLRTAIFLLGSLAFPYVSQIYPPLDLDVMLIFFGLIFFAVLFLAVILERRARNRQDIEVLKRVYSGFIPLPWILAATLFVNGRLTAQKYITYYPTSAVGRFNMKGIDPREPSLAGPLVASEPAFRAPGRRCGRFRSLSRRRFCGSGRRTWGTGHSVVLRRLPPVTVIAECMGAL